MELVTISRALSYTVMAQSLFAKLPQVSSIYSSRSTLGLNVRGYWMEIAAYLIGASFGYSFDFHFSTYGEAVFLAIQSALIIALTVYFGRLWNLENIGFFTVFVFRHWVKKLCLMPKKAENPGNEAILTITFIALTGVRVIPEAILRLLLFCTLPLAVGSKLTQIKELYRIKAQGDVSALMWGLAAYGCGVRMFTAAVEVKDVQVFVNYLASFVLNTIVVIQCFYYGKTKKQM